MQVRTLPRLTITKKTKGKLPRLPFLALKDAILGKRYELSIVFSGAAESRRLNRIYRKNDKAANILSFPLGAWNGEIYLNEREIGKSEKAFGLKGEKLLIYFLIHGMLHLKGNAHGNAMEKKEARLRARFGI